MKTETGSDRQTRKHFAVKDGVAATLGLTYPQWCAMDHRLSENGALAECLSDFVPGETEPEFSYEDANDAAYLLWQGRLTDALALGRPLVNAILRDCVEGSTWVPVHADEYGDKSIQATTALRTLERAAARVAAYIGVDPDEITVPDC